MKKAYSITVPNMRIIDIDGYEIMQDGSCKLVFDVEPIEKKVAKVKDEHLFRLIDSSKINFEEYFWNYEPRSYYSKAFKDYLLKAVDEGVKAFYCPICAPSVENDNIVFKVGEKVAVGYSIEWWREAAKKYKPEKNSRIGNRDEYIIFMAFLINLLIENGWTVEDAWSGVCNDSRNMGNFLTRSPSIENAGSCEMVGFYDLGNVRKVTFSEKGSDYFCWIAGGSYKTASFICPLANLDYYKIDDNPLEDAVGWIVYDA